MKKIILKAKVDNLDEVLSFIDAELEEAGCTPKKQMQIDLSVEELYVNIANYAYGDSEGDAEIWIDTNGGKSRAEITFIDSGIPYNPLEKDDPDVTLPAEEREIGGLGIFLVKKNMDDVIYKYEDNKNKLTIIATW